MLPSRNERQVEHDPNSNLVDNCKVGKILKNAPVNYDFRLSGLPHRPPRPVWHRSRPHLPARPSPRYKDALVPAVFPNDSLAPFYPLSLFAFLHRPLAPQAAPGFTDSLPPPLVPAEPMRC